MKKRMLTIFISIVLIISVIAGVILTTKLLYKVNNKTEDEIMAEKNIVVVGEESIFYVDLTKNPNDYEKIGNIKEDVNKEEKVEENALNQINEEYFNIELDLNSGMATVDGNEIKIKDLLKITEEEEKELLSSEEKFYDYLNDNVIGDIEYKDGTVQIENPYSTNTIMMKTSNLTEIEDCGDVQSIVKVANDIYCVHYENAKETKEGYNILKENNLVENVCKDAKITTLDDVSLRSESLEVDSLAVTGNNYAWGVGTTGLRRYVNKLNYGNNNSEIKVAVVDTGVRITHEVFANETTSDRIDTTYSYNYVSDNKDIADDNGHGTMVAGIISEATSNNVKIVPVKIMGSDGTGDYSSAMEGLAAIANKVDAINLSLGIKETEITSDARALGEEVLKQLYDGGKIVVCASGNDGEENVYYPASSQYTFAVSALNTENSIATFSNYGSTIDFAAPGQGLILPYYTGDNLYNASFSETSDEYKKNSGTSFAAPFVTAAASLIKAENTNYTVQQVKDVLEENCEDLGATGKDNYYGYGGLDFDNNMFSKPVIASTKVSNEWAKENTIEIYAVCGNHITNWIYLTSEGEPTGDSDWRTFTNPSTTVRISITTEKNGNYYIWFKDEKENITNQLVQVQYVDNTAPTITNQLVLSENKTTGFKAAVSTQDTDSGLAKINWYYKKEADTDYQMVTDTYTANGTGDNNNTEKTHQFSNLESNTKYYVYAEIYDIAGNFVTTTVTTTKTLESIGNDDNTNTNNTNTNSTNTNSTNTNNTNTNSTNTNSTNTNNTNTNSINTNNTNTNSTNNTNTNSTNTNNTNTNSINTNNTNTNNTNTNSTNTTNTNTNSTNTNNTNTNNTNTENTNIDNTNINNTNSNLENINNENTNLGGSNNGNSNTLNSIKPKLDNSTSSNNLPYTGKNKIIILSAVVILISGVFTFVKYKKLKELK